MALLADAALNAALSYVEDNGTYLHLCSTEPTNYTEASSTYSRGSVALAGSGANWTQGDLSPNGRKTTLDSGLSITPGSSGTVGWLAVVSGAALLAVFDLSAVMTLTSGVAVTLPAVSIELPDFTAA